MDKLAICYLQRKYQGTTMEKVVVDFAVKKNLGDVMIEFYDDFNRTVLFNLIKKNRHATLILDHIEKMGSTCESIDEFRNHCQLNTVDIWLLKQELFLPTDRYIKESMVYLDGYKAALQNNQKTKKKLLEEYNKINKEIEQFLFLNGGSELVVKRRMILFDLEKFQYM